MSNSNNYGSSVSRTLNTDGTAFDGLIFQQGKPPLDSEVNFIGDIQSEARRKAFADETPSGFLKPEPFVFSPVDPGATPNAFGLSATKVVVNGYIVNFNPSGTGLIGLPAAPSGLGNHRYDFVFLEVFRTLITGGSAANKPSTTAIYLDGNVQNASGNPSDDIIDTAIGIETTKRIQIQYRYRVYSGALLPDGQNANMYSSLILAQGPTGAPVSGYPFTNMGSVLNDSGLWRAGNGDAASRTNLGTVDGYVYSIPIALVFRRAIGAYSDASVNGQNASATAIASGTSDRIDGLFYDSVDASDVIDLRHWVRPGGFTHAEILKAAIEHTLRGQNNTKHTQKIRYEIISETGVAGYANLNTTARADQVRTKWSDLQATETSYVAKLNVGDTNTANPWHVINGNSSWESGDQLILNVPTDAPAGTIILSPAAVYNNAGLVAVVGSWTGVGTSSAVFTLGTNAGLTSQEIWIVFNIQYAPNEGLTFVPDQLLKLDYTNYANFPIVQGSYNTYYGTVLNGNDLMSTDLRKSAGTKQMNLIHAGTFNNHASNFTLTPNNKELAVTPVIRSVAGSNRVMSVKNYQNSSKKIWLPMPTGKTWFIRGVYTSVSGGTEVATAALASQIPGPIDNVGKTFSMPLALGTSSFAEVSQVVYLPGPTNLIGSGPDDYQPVFIKSSSNHVNKFILVKNSDGSVFTPASLSAIPGDYQITFRHLPTANVNAYTVDTSASNNWIQLNASYSAADNVELFLDIDFVGAPHADAQLKIAYKYLPYQGLTDLIGTELHGELHSLSGMVHSDGTGNSNANVNRVQHPRPLVSYFPTPASVDYLLTGGSIAGPGKIGMYGSSNLCHSKNLEVLDLSSPGTLPLAPGMEVTSKFEALNAVMENGANDAMNSVESMLGDLDGVTAHQAVIFGLAKSKLNFNLQNELVLFTWTNTETSSNNEFSATNTATLGVDFFFIPGRPLVK